MTGNGAQALEHSKLAAQTAQDALQRWPYSPIAAAMVGTWFTRGENGLPPSTTERLRTAADYLEIAVAGAPDRLEVLMPASSLARTLGRWDLAQRLNERLVEIHPICGGCQLDMLVAYNWIGRYDRAIATYERTRTLGLFPEGPVRLIALSNYAAALLFTGDAEAALAVLAEIPPAQRDDLSYQAQMAITLSSVPGREAEFEAAFASLGERLTDPEPDPRIPSWVAEIHAWIGDVASAYEALRDVPVLDSHLLYGWYAERLSADERWPELTGKSRESPCGHRVRRRSA